MSENEPVGQPEPLLPEPARSGAAAEPGPAAEPVEAAPSPEQLLREAQLKAAEHYDAWLRARAEADNARRRAQEDVAKATRYAIDQFAKAMLPVRDSLEATLASTNATPQTLREGVELTLKQLAAGLAAAGIVEIDPLGEKFDPHRHQAIGTQQAEGEPNRVVAVLQKGYLLRDRVLRPALVMVSSDSAS